jgi:signal transduction histidine kinase
VTAVTAVTAVPPPDPPDHPAGGGGGWPRWTARLRLTLWYGGLFVLAGLVLVATSYLLVHQRLMPTGGGKATTLQSPTGTVVCSPQGACQTLPVGAGAPAPDPNRSIVVTGGQLGALKSSFLADALRTFLQTMLGVLALMALLSLGLGWLVAGRVLRPLQRITATAKRLSERTLHQRIALQGPDDELKELADTFDGLLTRLDAAFDSQRRFAANASHELRTPLAISRTEVDVALADPDTPTAELRAMAERVRDATGRSERLIEGLLTLARSEQQLRVWEPVDLADAAALALEHTRHQHQYQDQDQAGVAGLRLVTRLRPAPVEGDPALLERMIANLVENAVRHNQPPGWLDVATGVSDGRVFVRVANGGRAIPPDQVESLFEPFRRLHGRVASPSGVRGAGLGLSIVRSVARAHGGDAHARALPGGGLEVTVRLPVRAEATMAIPSPQQAALTRSR